MEKEYVYSFAEACKKSKNIKSTAKRWDTDGLLNMPGVYKRIWDPKNKTDNRWFSGFGIKYLAWLKGFSGAKKSNAFYISIIIDAIHRGRVDLKKVGWPSKP